MRRKHSRSPAPRDKRSGHCRVGGERGEVGGCFGGDIQRSWEADETCVPAAATIGRLLGTQVTPTSCDRAIVRGGPVAMIRTSNSVFTCSSEFAMPGATDTGAS